MEQLIDARWNESLGSERQLRYEMQRNKDVLERREMNTSSNKNEGETIGGKRKRNTEETNDMSKKKSKLGKSVGEVNNEYDVDDDSKGEMPWGKKITSFEKVVDDLKFARKFNPENPLYQWEEHNLASLWRVIDTFAKSRKKSRGFISYGTFRMWSQGKRTTALSPVTHIILKKFHKKCRGVLPWDDSDDTDEEADII